MNEREELKQELEQELYWVKYRQNMLDIIEEKLLEMKKLIERAKQDNLMEEELEVLNTKINNLAIQIKALDGESRKLEQDKILE